MVRGTWFAVGLTAVLMGCSGTDTTDPIDTDLVDTEVIDTEVALDGAALFATHCSSCHAADGTGTSIGADITGELGKSDSQLKNVMLNGEGAMPAVAVTDEEAQAIVDWMRDTF
jgi:mono/diheme cytochrome c family protein